MCLQFWFLIFWRKDFGAKAAHKMFHYEVTTQKVSETLKLVTNSILEDMKFLI
jgi:hypothetical protein